MGEGGLWKGRGHQLECSRPLCDNKGTVRGCKLLGPVKSWAAGPPLVVSANARYETKSICGTVQHCPLSKHRCMGVMKTVTASTLQTTAILTVLMCLVCIPLIWMCVTLRQTAQLDTGANVSMSVQELRSSIWSPKT